MARNTPVSLLPPEKRNIQTYTSNTKTPFCASRPNYAPDSHSRGGWDVCPVAQRRSQAQTSMHPAFFFLRTGPWPMAAQFIIQFYWSSVTEHIKKNSGVSWSRGPDPIVFCKSKKDQLSMAQICILHPRICCHTHKKKKKKSRADHRNNLPSQPSGDDVSFLITNCLFMLQQLPRAANKWLKECLDQAFRPLLSGGCYLVDSRGSSCLVWMGAEAGRPWLTAGPWGSARMAPRLYPPGSRVKARALPWGWRWKEMLEGNEKNLLAKFAIMNTSPRGESEPAQVATE